MGPDVLASIAASKVAGAAIKGADTLLSSLSNVVQNGGNISSLADVTRPANVQPIVLVDKALDNVGAMEDVMKLSLSIFTGYYLQAVSMLMNVGRIETLRVFDSLNPERSVAPSIKEAIWSSEAYATGLPSLEAFTQPGDPDLVFSLEESEPAAPQGAGISVTDDAAKKLYENPNLAVGKLINVELRDGEQKAKLPVIIRLLPLSVPSKLLSHIFTVGGNDSWGMRWELAKAGMIRPIADFIFGMDLLDQHRKALVNDTSGVYEAITDRRRNNTAKMAMTGNVSIADASNIAVISKETAKDVGRALYGKLESKEVRQKIFDNSYLLLLVVVDSYFERVTVYHRGLDLALNYSFKEIQMAEKNKGADLNELFKMFHQNLGSNI